jgi:hypothetical protein
MANGEWRMVGILALIVSAPWFYSLLAIRYLPKYTSITRSFDET